MRLVNGNKENEGTVEVCYAGLWGLIDDASWDSNEARVVCKQLGFRTEGSSIMVLEGITLLFNTLILI